MPTEAGKHYLGLGEEADEQTRLKQPFDAALLTWLTSVPPATASA